MFARETAEYEKKAKLIVANIQTDIGFTGESPHHFTPRFKANPKSPYPTVYLFINRWRANAWPTVNDKVTSIFPEFVNGLLWRLKIEIPNIRKGNSWKYLGWTFWPITLRSIWWIARDNKTNVAMKKSTASLWPLVQFRTPFEIKITNSAKTIMLVNGGTGALNQPRWPVLVWISEKLKPKLPNTNCGRFWILLFKTSSPGALYFPSTNPFLKKDLRASLVKNQIGGRIIRQEIPTALVILR